MMSAQQSRKSKGCIRRKVERERECGNEKEGGDKRQEGGGDDRAECWQRVVQGL